MPRIFELFTEVLGWILIVFSPLLIGSALGTFVYLADPNETRLIIGISLASIGLIVGILWATHIWKTTGTIWFLSRIIATPELDDKVEDEKTDDQDSNEKP